MQSLKLALIGYGKMGKAIEEIALQHGHHIQLKISSANKADLTVHNLQQCDAAIEFTNPESAVENIKLCLDAGVPVICGSTGWLAAAEEVKAYCMAKNGALLYASNFSIGVNIFFEINKKLAELMARRKEYHVSLKEIHHTQKKDAPSGTAITLAEQIIDRHPDITGRTMSNEENKINITSERTDPAPGTHHVLYRSPVDEIEIIHTAFNRTGFAGGAVLAAEFIYGKKGIFNMSDVLKDLSEASLP